MNRKRKNLTIAALVVFAVAILFAQWDLTASPDHTNWTTFSPIFVPPNLGPWGKRELASSNFWTWLAIGVVYAGLFALLGEPKISSSHPMSSARKSAYRYLLLQAMLDIRIYCPSCDEPSTDAALRERRYHASRIAGAIADWLHNLAEAAADDFERFDEDEFWKAHAHFCTRFPGELERYRAVFDERLK